MSKRSSDTDQATPRPRRSSRRKMRLFNIVPVRFRTNFLKHDYNAQELHLRVGDEVIVETSRGPSIARVEGHVHRRLLPAESIPRVLRRASEQDLEMAERNEEREEACYRFALERIRTRKLPMKLVRAQFMHDGSKIVFYFSADGRIDFRDLVKDLAHRFRTRIEMHQIGVRDGARMLGGIGPCGRELCCSTFLESFAPVSIRMAKEQGLTLNPKKVSGMCGRLMCCLVYEQSLYKKKRRKMPRPGTEVFTEHGKGTIYSIDVINSRVTVELLDTNRKLLDLKEVAFEEPKVDLTVDADALEPSYLWDDLLEDGAPAQPEAPRRSRRRRRARSGGQRSSSDARSKEKSADQASPPTQRDSKDAQDTKAQDRSTNRRRRKRRGDAPKADPKKSD